MKPAARADGSGVLRRTVAGLLRHGARLTRSRVAWLLGAAFLARLFFFLMHTPGCDPDGYRFLEQAESLLDGRGFAWRGQPETSLPPGYPAFIAPLFVAWPSQLALRLAHLGLSFASCCLVYFAVAPRSQRLAAAALLVLSLSPWTGRLMCSVLSETLGIFLMSALVFCISWHERGRTGRGLTFLIGALCTALVLTVPATIFLAFGVFCAIGWSCRRHPARLASLCAGGLLFMAPWQAYCYRATGRVQPTVYSEYSRNDSYSYSWNSGLSLWARAWMFDEDCSLLWSPWEMDRVPHRAFRSEEERVRVAACAEQLRAGTIDWAAYDESFRELALSRIEAEPWSYHLLMPLRRSVSLWARMGPVWRCSRERLGNLSPAAFASSQSSPGGQAADRERSLALLSLAVYVCYLLHPALFLALGLGAVRSRRLVPLVIVSAVILYTLISGYTAFGEERRNYPFYPALLFLAFYWPGRIPLAPAAPSSHRVEGDTGCPDDIDPSLRSRACALYRNACRFLG